MWMGFLVVLELWTLKGNKEMGDSATVVACISHVFKGVIHYLLVSRSCARPWEMVGGRVREREIDEDAMTRILEDAVAYHEVFDYDDEDDRKIGSTSIIHSDDFASRICTFFHVSIGPLKTFEVNICGEYKGFMWMNANQLGLLVRKDPAKLDVAAVYVAKKIVCGEFGKKS